MTEKWVVLFNKLTGKELSSMTVRGTFQGELDNTIELNAYESGITKNDIEVKIIER